MKLTEKEPAIEFEKMENSFAITQERGVYRKYDLYKQGKVILCKKGTGFLKIYNDGYTSSDFVHCVGININGIKWKSGKYGLLEVVK